MNFSVDFDVLGLPLWPIKQQLVFFCLLFGLNRSDHRIDLLEILAVEFGLVALHLSGAYLAFRLPQADMLLFYASLFRRRCS